MFVWTEENIGHLWQRHKVTEIEAEEVFYNAPIIRVSHLQPDEPRRYLAFGLTDAGRYLLVVFVREGEGIKPFSARNMTVIERKKYKQMKG